MTYEYYSPVMNQTNFSPLFNMMRAGDICGTCPNYHPGVYQLHSDQFQSSVEYIEPIQNHPPVTHDHLDMLQTMVEYQNLIEKNHPQLHHLHRDILIHQTMVKHQELIKMYPQLLHHPDLFQSMLESELRHQRQQRDLIFQTILDNQAQLHHRDQMAENSRTRIPHHPQLLTPPVVVERPLSLVPRVRPGLIEQVWHENLKNEFKKIHYLLHMPGSDPRARCFLASIDTEYPGVQSTPDRGRLQDPLYIYQQMKSNVNTTNIIQVGLTLANRHSHLFTWEFNFSDFDIETDVHNYASIQLLKSHGIDFNKNKLHGIDSLDFAKLCMGSGLLGSKEDVSLTWVGFQAANDFGYLWKIFARRNLPNHMEDFMHYVNKVFGASVFDIKHMITSIGAEIYGGLEKVAAELGLVRTAGESHSAGSDSLLTMQTFIQLLGRFLKPTRSGSSPIETLRKFTMIMSHVNKHHEPIAYFESLINGDEESEKENHRNLIRCHGLKGLGLVNSFVSV